MSLEEIDAYLLVRARLGEHEVTPCIEAIIDSAEHLLDSDYSSTDEKHRYSVAKTDIMYACRTSDVMAVTANQRLALSLARMGELTVRLRNAEFLGPNSAGRVRCVRKGVAGPLILATCLYGYKGKTEIQAALVSPDKLLSWHTSQLEHLLERIKTEKSLPSSNKDVSPVECKASASSA